MYRQSKNLTFSRGDTPESQSFACNRSFECVLYFAFFFFFVHQRLALAVFWRLLCVLSYITFYHQQILYHYSQNKKNHTQERERKFSRWTKKNRTMERGEGFAVNGGLHFFSRHSWADAVQRYLVDGNELDDDP